MIKIEYIESVGRKIVKLEDLLDDYYDAVNSTKYGVSSPLKKLNDALIRYPTGIHNDIITYCIGEYEKLIKGKPTVLASIAKYFDDQSWTTFLKSKANKSFRNELLEIFGYDKRFRSVKRKGIWFASLLNIKACPYCNAQYTIVTREKGNPKKAKFQFDHFYNKSSYPHLSVAMYNLIPSCAACNVTKSDKSMNLIDYYHPYESTIVDKIKFVLDNESVLKNLTMNQIDSNRIKIKIEPSSPVYKSFVEKHCKLYDIQAVYENHADIAEEILLKALMYSKSRQKELSSMKGLFKDDATFRRYLIGNYADVKDILKRPLAKFTQDIAKQLGLIDR